MTEIERLRAFIENQRVGNDKPMTQAEFADAIGYRREYINGMLNGQRAITDGFIGRFANIFGFQAAEDVFGNEHVQESSHG